MEIESIKNMEPQIPLMKSIQEEVNIQKEVQQDVHDEKVEVSPQSSQKQVAQLLASAQPLHVVQQIAQNQIEKDKGFDVRV
jgi:hypothetical protein